MPSEQLERLISEAVDGDDLFAPEIEVGLSLREQAELAQYRKLIRALRTLRHDVLQPAPDLIDQVLASVEEAASRHAIRSILGGRRAAYGLAAATAAGAAGALVLVTRSRRRLPLAG